MTTEPQPMGSTREDPAALAVVVLAAGKGTRMRSRRAKVLHDLCGRPMLGHVLEAARALRPERLLVVVGQEADEVREAFSGAADFVLQAEQRGTGHAVMQAMPKLEGHRGEVLVLYGDTPLLRPRTLARMREVRREARADLVMLTADGPTIPGRILRDSLGRISRVVETQDATAEQLRIPERNTGVYLLGFDLLREGIAQLDDDNVQGELYLTDVVGHAVERGRRVEGMRLEDVDEALGINNREELAQAAAIMRRRISSRHMEQGVTITDPASTAIDVGVRIGRDSVIEPGCVILGPSVIGEGVHLKPSCTVDAAVIGDGSEVGPFANLRPGTELQGRVIVGNFVEIKASRVGAGSRISHLAYVGDCEIGERVNVGAGAIVVNYDGEQKHATRIGDGAFIGSNASLIAPVTIGAGAFVAAGSTIDRDVPGGALAVARARPRLIEGRLRVTAAPANATKNTKKRTGKAARKRASGKQATRKKAAKKKAAKKKAAKKKATKKRPAKKRASKQAAKKKRAHQRR